MRAVISSAATITGGKVAVVAQDGSIEWECLCGALQGCWELPNGNFLFCHVHGAIEITLEKKIMWDYKAPAKTEVHACQPLADGTSLGDEMWQQSVGRSRSGRARLPRKLN